MELERVEDQGLHVVDAEHSKELCKAVISSGAVLPDPEISSRSPPLLRHGDRSVPLR